MPLKTGYIQDNDYQKLLNSIEQESVIAILYFYSVDYNGEEISKVLKQKYPDADVMGCSMIGGFNDKKLLDKGVTALSFGNDIVEKSFTTMDTGFHENPAKSTDQIIQNITTKLQNETVSPDHYLGIILIDGLGLGEVVMNKLSISDQLNIPIIGGASADDLTFNSTKVTLNDVESPSAIALMILKMKVPFYYNHYVHYIPTEAEVVVTSASPRDRVVWELNGRPAAEVYAEIVGKSGPADLDVNDYALNPLGVIVGNTVYTRSPNAVIDGKGLRFYCWLEAGNKLKVLKKGDILANAKHAIEEANQFLNNKVQGVILFNCVLRYLELKKDNKLEDFSKMFNQYSCIGFNTFGEELFTHHNQTLTAVFFGY